MTIRYQMTRDAAVAEDGRRMLDALSAEGHRRPRAAKPERRPHPHGT